MTIAQEHLAHEQRTSETFEPRYDLLEAEADSLCREFLEGIEPNERVEKDFGCYLIRGDSKFSNMGRYIETTVFNEEFKNESDYMEKQYGPYENTSSFFVVVDQVKKKPIGVMRIIENSPAGLKSIVDLEGKIGITPEQVAENYDMDFDRTVDVGTLALLPEYRDMPSATPIRLTYRSLWLMILNNPRFDHMVAIIDDKADKLLASYHFPFHSILDSDSFEYMGSKKSWARYATTGEYREQVPYWAEKLSQETSENNGISRLIGYVLHELTDDSSPLDSSLGFPKTTKL